MTRYPYFRNRDDSIVAPDGLIAAADGRGEEELVRGLAHLAGALIH